MDRRVLRILVSGFACLWFGMLVPIHNRGQIQLPGPKAAAAAVPAAAGHCPRGGPDSACHKQQQGQPASSEQPAQDGGAGGGGCAVCHFVAGLDVPPPVTLGVAPLELLAALPPERATIAPARHAALPFHGLDPPLA